MNAKQTRNAKQAAKKTAAALNAANGKAETTVETKANKSKSVEVKAGNTTLKAEKDITACIASCIQTHFGVCSSKRLDELANTLPKYKKNGYASAYHALCNAAGVTRMAAIAKLNTCTGVCQDKLQSGFFVRNYRLTGDAANPVKVSNPQNYSEQGFFGWAYDAAMKPAKTGFADVAITYLRNEKAASELAASIEAAHSCKVPQKAIATAVERCETAHKA